MALRPWQIGVAFGLCAAAVLAALGWVTAAALDAERAEAEARGRAAFEESVRRTLWRMDTALAPFLAQENARPYFHYSAFYPAQRAYTRMFAEIQKGEVLVPSPLLTLSSPLVRLHFQFEAEGELTSPQAPTGNMCDLAESSFTSNEKVQSAAACLKSLGARLDRAALAQALGPDEGALRPAWIGGDLLLARRVATQGKSWIQGCWLDWLATKEWLLREVRPLLPDADLEPDRGSTEPTRRLACLPVRLAPGVIPAPAAEGGKLLRFALLAGWTGGLVAVGALGALCWGLWSLSERRGTFVSAVTHELRTPLTTFRLYTEMLAGGMVRDEEQRRTYLGTLRLEAERLGHLVENVLAYAGLERNGFARRSEVLEVAGLVDRISERLAARAAQAGMTLAVRRAVPDGARIRADAAALERILFNLVDNAGKYAGQAADRTICLDVSAAGEFVLFRVRDRGPGVPRDAARRLFRPFSKSAREAAGTAPGVGLGLALSRRLARAMGGELRHVAAEAGACFELSLPSAGTSPDQQSAGLESLSPEAGHRNRAAPPVTAEGAGKA